MADGYLNFDTKIDGKGFSSGVSKLGSLAKGGLKVLGTAVAGVTTAMGAGIAAGIKYNATIEQYTTSFEVMTGSADKAAKIVERLKEIGAKTPFEMTGLADTTQLLMNYGLTADDAISKMMMLGDISQGNADKMNRIAMAYGQMSSAGKVCLEDVKQMIEAGFNPLQEISESTGESMASLYDRISKGTLTVDEITASMERATSAGGKYYQSMEKQSQTFSGMISTLKDNAMQLLGDVVEPICTAMTDELLPAAIKAIEDLQKVFEKDGLKGLMESGGAIIANFLTGMMKQLPSLVDGAVQILNSFVEGLNSNIDSLVSAGTQIVQTLCTGLLQTIPQILSLGMQSIASFAAGISKMLPQLIPVAIQCIKTLTDTLTANIEQIISAGIELIVSLAEGIGQAIPQLIPLAVDCVLTLVEGLINNIGELVSAGIDLLTALVEGIGEAIPLLLAKAPVIIIEFIGAIVAQLPKLIALGPKLIIALAKGVIEGIGNLLKAAVTAIGKFTDKFKNVNWASVGTAIIRGIAGGITGAAGFIVGAAKRAAKKALNAAKNFLGIHSPSTVFRDEVGKYMAQGMGVGFEENVPVDDMQDSIEQSVNQMKTVAIEETSQKSPMVQRLQHAANPDDDGDGDGGVYEIHVHTHIGAKEVAEETAVFNDEELGKRSKRKERGNAG